MRFRWANASIFKYFIFTLQVSLPPRSLLKKKHIAKGKGYCGGEKVFFSFFKMLILQFSVCCFVMLQMHCSSLENECERREGGDVLVAIAAMVTEGRIPGKLNQTKSRGFYEGPHCPVGKQAQEHRCDSNNNLVS